jgi:STE24 endopeptidase
MKKTVLALAILTLLWTIAVIVAKRLAPIETANAIAVFGVDYISRVNAFREPLSAPRKLMDVADGVLLVLFALSYERIADASVRLTRGRVALANGLQVALFLGVRFLLWRPISILWLEQRQRFGQTSQTLASALTRELGAELLEIAEWAGGVMLLAFLVHRWPRRGGWIVGPIAAAGCLVVATLWPIAVEPCFHKFVPLAESAYASRVAAVSDLAARAGLAIDDVFVMDASRVGNEQNAYIGGSFFTTRMVLFDTMLDKQNDAQVRAIVGHEMGHFALGHQQLDELALAACLLVAGLCLWPLLSRIPRGRLGLLVMVSWASLEVLTWPIVANVTRAQEVQADAYGFDAVLDGLTGDAQVEAARVIVDAHKQLTIASLQRPTVNPVGRWLSTHPPTVDRIAEVCARVPLACAPSSVETNASLGDAP